VIQYTSELKA